MELHDNERDAKRWGASPLQNAAYSGDSSLVQQLLRRGADVNEQPRMYGTALSAALLQWKGRKSKRIVRLLLDHKADVNVSMSGQLSFGDTALQIAVWADNLWAIELLLKHQADINAQGGLHGGALQLAVLKQNRSLVEYLLKHGAEVDAQSGAYGTALQTAAAGSRQLLAVAAYAHPILRLTVKAAKEASKVSEHSEPSSRVKMIELILNHGASVNTQCGVHGNVLIGAVTVEDKAAIKLLLNHGADINAQVDVATHRPRNVLMAAVNTGDEAIVDLLLDHGAHINKSAALQFAAKTPKDDGGRMIKLLLDRGADINADDPNDKPLDAAIISAADIGNQSTVALLLRNGANVNAQGGKWVNALQAAACNGHAAIVELLLDHGAEINAQGGIFDSALQAAACHGHHTIVQHLLNRGANVNIQGGTYGNALTLAARKGHQVVIDLLLRLGADVNARCEEYSGALQAAVEGGYEAITRILLNHGADFDAQGGRLGSVLQAAACGRNKATFQMIVSKVTDINAQCGYWGNALNAAVFHGNEAIVRLTLDNGATVNAQNGHFGNALYTAVAQNYEGIIQLLLARGADATIQPHLPERMSLLHHAVLNKNLPVLQLLLRNGARDLITSIERLGKTPLHYAAQTNQMEMIRCLLDEGASPDCTDFFDVSAVQAAIQGDNRDAALLLYTKAQKSSDAIKALDWQKLFDPSCSQVLEIIGGTRPIIRSINATEFKGYLTRRSYPFLTTEGSTKDYPANEDHFLEKHRKVRRMFVIPERTRPIDGYTLECHWWVKEKQGKSNDDGTNSEWLWRVPSEEIIPSISTIYQIPADSFFLHCRISFTCVSISGTSSFRNSTFSWKNSLNMTQTRKILEWVMVQSEQQSTNRQPNDTILQSCAFLHDTQCTTIPISALDLFPWLLKDLSHIWSKNRQCVRGQLVMTRSLVLKSNGTDPGLIQLLIKDAQILDEVKASMELQREALELFRSYYVSESWRLLHEEPFDIVQQKTASFEKELDIFTRNALEELSDLTNQFQKVVQLEFSLTSINEAQKSTSTNRSLKRLTWVTFIFLPLTFIATVFGMNVDVLKDNPHWWWYLPFAGFTVLSTFGVWLLFKRSNSLEGTLEEKFDWLFSKRWNEQDADVEQGKTSHAPTSSKTADFSAFGKKRS